jgi:hypothetical protein
MEDVIGEISAQGVGKPSKWEPTTWAKAVCTWHPVTRFIVDVPFDIVGAAFAWKKSSLPPQVFDELSHHDSRTPEAANDALYTAIARVVRKGILV